jgi:hypothetical protein
VAPGHVFSVRIASVSGSDYVVENGLCLSLDIVAMDKELDLSQGMFLNH